MRRPQTPRYACQFGRLVSTSSVGAWTPCAASSAAVDALGSDPSSAEHARPSYRTAASNRGEFDAVRGGRTVPPQARHGCASDFDCCMPVPAVPDRLEASSAAFSTRSRARSTSRFSTEATAASIHAPNISGTTAISPHTIT